MAADRRLTLVACICFYYVLVNTNTMSIIYRTCRETNEQFEITDADQKFYESRGVPLPTLSPKDRLKRRMQFRNERKLHA